MLISMLPSNFKLVNECICGLSLCLTTRYHRYLNDNTKLQRIFQCENSKNKKY